MSILEIPAAQYHADQLADQPSLSASIAKLLIQASPAHARAAHPRLNPDYAKTADDRFDVGVAAHSLILEGQSVIEVVGADSWRTKDAREAREQAIQHGRVPLLAHQAADVYAMANAIRDQLAAYDMRLFVDGKPEQTLVWDDQGVMCRARLDWLDDDYTQIIDLKTTSRTANPDRWTRNTLYDIGCDLQAAAYLRGLEKVTGVTAVWRWVVVETSPPYALSVITPSAAVLAIGEAKWEKALGIWRRCLETDQWPAYPPELHYAELPPWIESQWLEREAREDIAA